MRLAAGAKRFEGELLVVDAGSFPLSRLAAFTNPRMRGIVAVERVS